MQSFRFGNGVWGRRPQRVQGGALAYRAGIAAPHFLGCDRRPMLRHARRIAHPHADPAFAHRRDRRGRVGCLRRRRQSVRQPRLPLGGRGQRLGDRAHRLAAAARGVARRARAAGRGGADVCEVAQLRRIRLRPRLGAGAGARRRQLLPEIAGRGAVQPGCPARGCSAVPAAGSPPRRWPRRWCRRAANSTSPRSTSRSAARRSGRRSGRPVAAAARHAVPLGECGLFQLRGFPGRAVVTQAQGAAAGAARRARAGADVSGAARRRDHGARIGRRFMASTARRWTANGARRT